MASSIQYTWGINNLERTLADGIVYTVHYAIDAFDGTYRSGAYGSIGLEAPEEDQAIPYSDLTFRLGRAMDQGQNWRRQSGGNRSRSCRSNSTANCSDYGQRFALG
jgi:hypothetical protein